MPASSIGQKSYLYSLEHHLGAAFEQFISDDFSAAGREKKELAIATATGTMICGALG